MDAAAEREIERAATALLVRVADAIARDAQTIAPVDTGRLRASIEASLPEGKTVRVHARANYAGYVELGTRHMAAQPYLSPALFRVRPL